MHDFTKHTFRASSIGHIMSDPKGKRPLVAYNEHMEKFEKKMDDYANTKNKETKTAQNALLALEKMVEKAKILEAKKDELWLSDTCKTHLADVYTSVVYGRRQDIKSKYLEKGLKLEEDAITEYCLATGNMHRKNTERKYNDFVEGELDFVDEIRVHDTKVNWSIIQFNRVAAKKILPLYHWQLDTYMWLWEKKKARLVYVLLNTPEHLIQLEIRKMMYELFGQLVDFDSIPEEYKGAFDEVRRLHTYDDIPVERKMRLFDVEYDEERIERIKSRVIDCRIWLNEFDSKDVSTILSNDNQTEDEDESED